MKRIFSLLLLLFVVSANASEIDKKTSDKSFSFLSKRSAGQTDRVSFKLDVVGETKYGERDQQKREKMSVNCALDYLEKNIEVSGRDACRSLREYQKISVAVNVGDDKFQPNLRPERRLICAEIDGWATKLFSLDGGLTREELDAIDVQANSLLLDGLLPDKPVAVGDSWSPSSDFWAAMLGLDAVAKTTVKSVLKEVTDTVARFELSGQVEGAAYGASTVVELLGRYRFDRRRNRIDWLGMLIKENRQPSFVADGLEVTSRLEVTVFPAVDSTKLAAAAEKSKKAAPEQLLLEYQSPAGDWQLKLDRRWHINRQRPKSSTVVFRMLDRGELVGQCNISSLARQNPEKIISLEDFQNDVQKALGNSFGEFVEAGQTVNDGGYLVYRVVVRGKASGLDMQWRYYLVADRQGHQAAMTFITEQDMAERFGDADRQLVGTFRFVN